MLTSEQLTYAVYRGFVASRLTECELAHWIETVYGVEAPTAPVFHEILRLEERGHLRPWANRKCRCGHQNSPTWVFTDAGYEEYRRVDRLPNPM